MKRLTKILLLFVTIAAIAGGYGLYLYNKKPPDIKTAASEVAVSADSLVIAYNNDEAKANNLYLDKVIAVKGLVKDIKTEPGGAITVFLESGDPMAAVTCSFYETEAATVKTLRHGMTVTIKGVCTGKLMDVVLNKCSIVQ